MKIEREEKWIESFCKDVEGLMQNEAVQKMKTFPHHKKISTHFHSVYVAYCCHKVGKFLGMKTRELTRAAMLPLICHQGELSEFRKAKETVAPNL